MSTFTKTAEVQQKAFTPVTTVVEPETTQDIGVLSSNEQSKLITFGNFINTGNVPQTLVVDSCVVDGVGAISTPFTINGVNGLTSLTLNPNDGATIKGRVDFVNTTEYNTADLPQGSPVPTDPSSVTLTSHWEV